MKSIAALAAYFLVAVTTAAPDPLITPRAELAPRQTSSESDPALVGWIDATDGQFSDLRSCDYPATFSTSGTFAQCCAPDSDCTFWSSCSSAALLAGSTSLFCDQGYCNTAVVVPTVGASKGVDFLGCWATSLGTGAFTVVRDIGDADVAPASSTETGDEGTTGSSPTSTAADASASETSSSATESSTDADVTTGSAAAETLEPLTGVVGLVALLFGVL
ncbi:hypothetical protein BKA58DRAFT_440950 [Alternaria rosae]|uniref:uncharacterized protein n=1 Tax=Alternaria rosae TaxID=1187941 RepID=UPI001E8CA361|nr:uncharacterized protein BKA58DRAFT_440950 [Alternaria rosae]KAH6868504.1 hypothetical protein BKA58DRAFT_440950 [Alternaria rosae]